MPLGIDLQPASGLRERHAFADAGHDVLQIALAGIGVEHVIGREQRRLRSRGDLFQSCETPPVVAAPRHGRAEPDVALRQIVQTRERRGQTRQIA